MSRLAHVMHRVATEELSDNTLVKMVGQVVRGEKVVIKKRIVQTVNGYQEVPYEVITTTTPQDQVRGLMIASRLKDLDLGIDEGAKKVELGEAMKLYTLEQEGYDDIVYRKHGRRTIEGRVNDPKADSDEEG